MDKKLTLSMNSLVIDRAKQYARDNNLSLSRMIEQYLASLTKPDAEQHEGEEPFTSLVDRLIGVIELPEMDTHKSDYADYLLQKYQ
ncbi:DUF6364 family protein [Neolewinella sp.]|uniref:DUF6364 family protein n=1 Tax=Neolewinella sp. TaxID=2993543 RepID=UPI003B51A288